MSAVHPFPPVELESVLRKIAKQEPITRDERQLAQRQLDETPVADAAPGMKRYQVPADPRLESLGLHDDVVFELGPCELGDFPAEEQGAIQKAMDDVRAGRAKLVPHDEVLRQLDERLRRERGGNAA